MRKLNIIILHIFCTTYAILRPSLENCPTNCDCKERIYNCTSRLIHIIPKVDLAVKVYYSYNRIHDLPENWLENATNLKSIHLDNNLLETINQLSFTGANKLQLLNFSCNSIEELIIHYSSPILKLTTLDLSSNLLTVIPQNLSSFAPNLQTLDLSSNLIKTINFDISYNIMKSLTYLDISNNNIKEIMGNDVKYLGNTVIKTLKLDNCNTNSIHPNFLSTFSNIKYLHMKNNELNEDAMERMFQNVSLNNNLTSLHIQGMKKSITVTYEIFRHIKNLEVLDMSNGNLIAVEPQIFKTILKIKTINMANNKLSRLKGIDYLRNHSLSYLNLRSNRIEDLSYISLRSLKYFDLSYNRVKTVPANWLTDNKMLKKLNLRNNKISKISEKSLRRSNIEFIDVSHNKLKVLNSFGASSIKHIDSSFNEIKSISIDLWKNLDSSLQKLNLSNNNLAKIPKYAAVNLKELAQVDLSYNPIGKHLVKTANRKTILNVFNYVQELLMDSCEIDIIPDSVTKKFNFLTTLSLSNNIISNLQDLHLNNLKHLLNLNLTKNQLENVNPKDLKDIAFLESIDLSFNPWNCLCNIQSFIKWLNKTSVSIEFYSKNSQRYICQQPYELYRIPLKNINLKELNCDVKKSKTIIKTTIISVICFVSFSLFLLLVVRFCNIGEKVRILQSKWQIRYREVSSLDTHEVHCDSSTV
ncbi:unnamed protein product [Dimorphilus gyrociliatus]|uniref:LRRCT domain-containing protein n=1 Tax=Dimorphilus gyrociliatus TaxID=2664684 RepID=A0A7I8VLC1_9ANNE|nr:unnamed protein product [Dimorphilus gyrociliatus]